MAEQMTPTQVIEKSFDAFKGYVAGNMPYEDWHYIVCQQMDNLSKECKPEQDDYYLADCVLKMFLRGAVEIEHKRTEWQMADICVSFKGKEYKTQLPIYDFGVFEYAGEKDGFWQMLIFLSMKKICKEIYDRFMPMVSA